MSEIKLAQHKPPSERGVAWCPDCLSYGTPFMDRNDRVCGNCGKENLEYLWSERHLPRCETCRYFQPHNNRPDGICEQGIGYGNGDVAVDFGCVLHEEKKSHED